MTEPTETSPASPPTPVEMVRKVYARDLKAQDRVHTVFRVARKEKNQSRAGKAYLVVSLADKSGELDARVFDKVDALDAAFAAGDYVLVQGAVGTFHGHLQLLVEQAERLDPGPIDPREFTPPPSKERGTPSGEGLRAVEQIREMVTRVSDEHVRALLEAFLDDPHVVAGLPRAPAAKGVHHAYPGGLADHLLSVMRLAVRIADHYPMADRDLLLAGALLHDIGKVTELHYEQGRGDYTDEGRLVGHLVMTAQQIHAKAARIDGFPAPLEHHLTHLVLAHHGQLEFGSPKPPMTLEALLLHFIDYMDSRVASWLELMQRDTADKWADATRQYERFLWKAAPPTAKGRPPVARKGPRKDKDKDKDRERRPRPERTAEPKAAEERPKRAPEPKKEHPTRDPGLPSELAFKPFALLAKEPPAPAAEGSSEPAAAPESPTVE